LAISIVFDLNIKSMVGKLFAKYLKTNGK